MDLLHLIFIFKNASMRIDRKKCFATLRIESEMTMDNLTGVDKNYINWITEVSNRFKQSQIKAAVKVNDEMLRFTAAWKRSS